MPQSWVRWTSLLRSVRNLLGMRTSITLFTSLKRRDGTKDQPTGCGSNNHAAQRAHAHAQDSNNIAKQASEEECSLAEPRQRAARRVHNGQLGLVVRPASANEQQHAHTTPSDVEGTKRAQAYFCAAPLALLGALWQETP